MEVKEILAEQNPWWRNPDSIRRNRYIERWEKSGVKRFPKAYMIESEHPVIYIIKGPRQVGKSTGILLKIKELLASGENPRNIVYIHCEAFETRKELEEALRFVSERKKFVWIFIDEATHIRDWYISLKYLRDIGLLENAVVIVTGSSSIDLAKASSYLAGRRGEEKGIQLDRAVLPMSFREFVACAFPELNSAVEDVLRGVNLESVLNGRLPEGIYELKFLWKEISSAFETYLTSGGYPLAADELLSRGKIGKGIYLLFLNLVRRDLQRQGYSPQLADEILSRLVEVGVAPVSYHKIKAGTSILSPTTVAEYLEALVNSFVIAQILYFDISARRPVLRKERKYIFRDPFIFHAVRYWVLGGEPFEMSKIAVRDPMLCAVLAEYVLGEHLIRVSAEKAGRTLADPFSSQDLVGYWSGGGVEVDFVARIGGELVPFEVKYQSIISKSDLRGIVKAASILRTKGILVTKDVSQLGEGSMHVRIPLPMLLLIM